LSKNSPKLKDFPNKCPKCHSWEVYHGKFAPGTEAGEYYCEDCGWGIDATTGELTNPGKYKNG